ncbi:MAG: hypothetical protein K9H64_16830 [Bacteroidales bacterium]|nr:hypothetical protein [Bacteroidales bacterium]MCF8454393.1 hypothetical protein [Bacteroidales bacterium]
MGTRAIAPYKEGKVCLTQKGDAVYVIYLAEENEKGMPSKIFLSSISPADDAKMTLLGTNQELSWEKVGNGFVVNIPEKIQKKPPCEYAWVVKIDKHK